MRNVLQDSKITASALKSIEVYHSEYIKEVDEAIVTNQYVVIGMRQNPVVKSALRLLDKNNITYKYIEHGSYFSKWKERLAIKLWSGWPTFPMIFVDGKLIGGRDELKSYLNDKKVI